MITFWLGVLATIVATFFIWTVSQVWKKISKSGVSLSASVLVIPYVFPSRIRNLSRFPLSSIRNDVDEVLDPLFEHIRREPITSNALNNQKQVYENVIQQVADDLDRISSLKRLYICEVKNTGKSLAHSVSLDMGGHDAILLPGQSIVFSESNDRRINLGDIAQDSEIKFYVWSNSSLWRSDWDWASKVKLYHRDGIGSIKSNMIITGFPLFLSKFLSRFGFTIFMLLIFTIVVILPIYKSIKAEIAKGDRTTSAQASYK